MTERTVFNIARALDVNDRFVRLDIGVWANRAGSRSVADAWAECRQGEWMAALLAALYARKTLTRQELAKAACAMTRARLSPDNPAHQSALPHLAAVEAWADGKIRLSALESALASLAAGRDVDTPLYLGWRVAQVVTEQRAGRYVGSHLHLIAGTQGRVPPEEYPTAAESAILHAAFADAIRAALPWPVVSAAIEKALTP